MSADALIDLIRKADTLDTDELLTLLAHLAERARYTRRGKRPLRWRDIRGAVAHPMMDEDAQQWVSRSRRDSDEFRGRRWN